MSDNDRIIFISIEGLRLDFNVKALTEVSEYFRGMFSGQFRESEQDEIKLEDVSQRAFNLFHEWVHVVRTEFIDLNLNELIELLLFTDRFMIDRLKELTYNRIRDMFAFSNVEAADAYKVLQASNLIGDLKDIFNKWLENSRVPPTDWKRDIIMDFTARLFRDREYLENSDLTNEVFQEHLLYLKTAHKKLLAQCSDYIRSHPSWSTQAHPIEEMSLYLKSLVKVKGEKEVGKTDELTAEEHKMLHEWMFDFGHDSENETLAVHVRLMAIAKRFHITQLLEQLKIDISKSIFKETEPSATLYFLVETYLLNKDSKLKNIFSLWVSRQYQASFPMNLYQLLQYSFKLFSWNHDIKVNIYALTDQAVNEIDRVFKVNRNSLLYYYDMLMNKSSQRDLEEAIDHMKKLKEELKDCAESQQEFKEFVTEKCQDYEKKLINLVNT